MEDSGIIHLFFARAEQALSETRRKYGTYLDQVAYGILRSRRDVEEVVNDTYLGAWNAIPPQIPASLKCFLAQIARNLALNRLDYLTAAKRARHAEALLSELEDCVPDRSSNPALVWETREIGRAVNRFLSDLEPRRRTLFVARYFYGRTLAETAEQLGITPRQAKYQLSLVRAALKTYLEQEGIEL